MSISNFIRFEDESGDTLYGELSSAETTGKLEGISASVLSGEPFTGFSRTNTCATVTKARNTITISTFLADIPSFSLHCSQRPYLSV